MIVRHGSSLGGKHDSGISIHIAHQFHRYCIAGIGKPQTGTLHPEIHFTHARIGSSKVEAYPPAVCPKEIQVVGRAMIVIVVFTAVKIKRGAIGRYALDAE